MDNSKIYLKVNALDGKSHQLSFDKTELVDEGAYKYYNTTFKLYGLKKNFKFKFNDKGNTLLQTYVQDKKTKEWHIAKVVSYAYIPSEEEDNPPTEDVPEPGEATPLLP